LPGTLNVTVNKKRSGYLQMITWGINALNHGSSLSVFNNSELMFTEAHASDELDAQTLRQAFDYGGPSEIYWYERPYIKN